VTESAVRTGMTSEERSRLETDGFLRVGRVLTDEELAEARGHVDRVVDEQRRRGQRPEYMLAIHVYEPYFLGIASHPRLLDILEAIMGPDIALVSTHLLCKPPEDGHAVAWHQDGAFAAIEPMSLVTLYLALDDCDRSNGCMRMLRGSHLDGPARHTVIREGGNTRKEIAADVIDAFEAVPLELRAGECSLHLPWVIHGSEANRSDRRRAGLPMRYVTGATRVVPVTDENRNPERQPIDPLAQVRLVRGTFLSESLRYSGGS
jgi:ectoine hydroxylase-related dioxygenase (phytanoyl-CoA dioxygenase family)